jgi:hypothetical protein
VLKQREEDLEDLMTELTKTQVLTALDEWAEYVPRFEKLSAKEKAGFLKAQGYASLHDLLAHIAVWWEEAESVISATLENRERPRRNYEFDSFNAESVARFKDTSDAELLNWYEAMRKKMIALVTGLTEEQLKIRRVKVWLDGPCLSHIKEHNLYASRFLIIDTLQREWADYITRFDSLPEEKQRSFLEKQGFARFRDLIAHIIGWWEDGLEAIPQVVKDAAYQPPTKDTDAYNAQLIGKFSKLDEAEVWKNFETRRQGLVDTVVRLPQDILDNTDVQGWLRADVIEHYYEHAY